MSNARAEVPPTSTGALPPLPSIETVQYGRDQIGRLRDKLRRWEAKARAEGSVTYPSPPDEGVAHAVVVDTVLSLAKAPK